VCDVTLPRVEEVAAALIAHGPLGIALVAVGWAFWKQSAELKEVQAARVEDAKRVVPVLLEFVDKSNKTVQELTEAVRKLEAAIERRRP
jgi:hypothetical protein